MNPLFIAWIVAGAAAFACLGLYLQGRGAQERVKVAQDDAFEARRALEALGKQAGKRDRQREGRADEVADLRRRLDKSKRRTAQLMEERRSEPGQIAALEQQVADLKSELRGTREELDRLRLRSKEVLAATAPPPPVVAAPPPAEDLVAAQREREEFDGLRARVGELEAALAKAELGAEQSRNRIKTQDKLYLAMRGELEAKKDRLQRQQEEIERLMAMRVALIGNAAADDADANRGEA